MPPLPPLPHHLPGHKPPHVREKNALIKSILVSTVITIAFYFILNYYNVPTAESITGSVGLWTGLVLILNKLLMEHP